MSWIFPMQKEINACGIDFFATLKLSWYQREISGTNVSWKGLITVDIGLIIENFVLPCNFYCRTS